MIVSTKKLRPYIKALLIIAIVAAGGYIFYFLRYNFYPALTGSETIYTLQKNMPNQSINIGEFNTLVNNIAKKGSSSPDIKPPNNPFK